MKKKIWVVLGIIVFLAIILLVFCTRPSISKADEKAVAEFKNIYDYLLDKDFKTAKIQGTTLTLYDENLREISQYELESKLQSKLLYIENRNTSIIFWMSGFDDLDGIMFMKSDWTNEAWNGLVRVTRIQGNAFKVYTYE